MNNFYDVRIPVKPYIEKFFTTREGSPIHSTDYSFTWLAVRPYLYYRKRDGLSHRQREELIKKFNAQLLFRLPVSKINLYGLRISDTGIILINRLLSHLFDKELYWFVRQCELAPGRYKGYKTAIENFCDAYKVVLEEDIMMNTILKKYKRIRDYEESKLPKLLKPPHEAA